MAYIVWNEPKVRNMLHFPTGMVGQDMTKRAVRVQAQAKRRVGVKSGKLRDSIKFTIKPTAFGQVVTLGSDVSYALLHHEGSRPHVILPVVAKQLVFVAGGRVVRTNRVNHPGTRPNRYLTDSIRLALINP